MIDDPPLPKLGPCPKCGGMNNDLYILIPRKSYTAVAIECHDCGHRIQSPSANTLASLKKHWDFISRIEKATAEKWNKQVRFNDESKEIIVAEVVTSFADNKLDVGDMMRDLTVETFKQAVEETKTNDKVLLVDFWATWCAPCRAMVPILNELEKEYEGDVDFCKVDVATQSELAQEWMIESIPKLFIFVNGTVKQVLGPCSKDALSTALDDALNDEE